MTKILLEQCPDCKAELPTLAPDAPRHRYMGGSASCWALFANMNNAGEPPIAPNRLTPPDFTDCLTVADIAAEPTAEERGEKTAVYVKQVYTYWSELHHDVLAQWYSTYIA